MDNIKNIARIILAAIGIYFLIQLIPQPFYMIGGLGRPFSWESVWTLFLWFAVFGISILLIWYFFFYLRDWLAEKIVGRAATCEYIGEVAWFPAALRLVCIFAGVYCLYIALWNLTQIIRLLQWYVERDVLIKTNQSPLADVFRLLLLVVVGVYLVWGAPHFVRWQVRKTLEQCRKLDNPDSASD